MNAAAKAPESSADRIGIGSRVLYKNGTRHCVGTVVEIFRRGVDDTPTHYSVRVDRKPDWWEQFGDTFAPAAEHVRKVRRD